MNCKDCKYFNETKSATSVDGEVKLHVCDNHSFIVGENAKACDKYEDKGNNE